jgi:nucleoside-triphosphatase
MRLFLTGTPGVGKTTLIRGVLKRLKEVRCAGFYTEEKRHKGQRIGFKIITLDGQEGTLASIGRKEPTVGRYSIHIAEFEKLILPQLDSQITPADLYVMMRLERWSCCLKNSDRRQLICWLNLRTSLPLSPRRERDL